MNEIFTPPSPTKDPVTASAPDPSERMDPSAVHGPHAPHPEVRARVRARTAEQVCSAVAGFLDGRSIHVSFSTIQEQVGLTRDELLACLKWFYQAGWVEQLPGNGSANARYRMAPGLSAAAVTAAVSGSTRLSDTKSAGATVEATPLSAQPSAHLQIRLPDQLASPTPAATHEEQIALDPSIRHSAQKGKQQKQEKDIRGSLPKRADAIPLPTKTAPLALANEQNRLQLAPRVTSVGSRLVFHFEKRPGGQSVRLCHDVARTWALETLAAAGQPRSRKPGSSKVNWPGGSDLQTSVITGVEISGVDLILHLNKRPGGRMFAVWASAAMRQATEALRLLVA